MQRAYEVRVLLSMAAMIAAAASFGCENKVQPVATPHSMPEQPVAASATPAAPVTLQRVEPKSVCMVNVQFMSAPQIPVAVEGKTYYGCCPMCERRLREQPDSRFGIDPVSKKRVDKAGAVIGKLESGKVLYFESEQTFRAFQQRT